MRRKIILIGGTPTAGKSTIASLLSKRLDLPWISTDQTRDIMRAMTNRDVHPDLHETDGHDAVSFFATFTPEEIANREWKQGVAAWPGNKTLIEKDYTYSKGFIVEGVNILPELLPTLETDDDVRSVFLIDDSKERTREVVFTRGLWDIASTYPDDLKEKEVQWTAAFSRRLEKSAKEFGYPIVKVEKNSEKDLAAVMKALNLS